MAYTRNITADDQVFFDTDRILSFTVYESTATDDEVAAGTAVPVDVSGWTFAWQLRKKVNSSTVTIGKTTASGISVTGTYDADPNVNTQRVEVTLADTDTYDPSSSPVVNVKAGTYYHALKRTDAGAEDVLCDGTFVLQQAAAWE